ncbi:MAG: polysaccharide biosynthesis protein [Bacteroidota bacterium]
MLGTMSVLSDAGISSGMLSQGGTVWSDKFLMGKVFHTGYRLRITASIIVVAICLPVLSYLLLKQDASFLTIILINISLLPLFYSSLSDNLLQIAPKLNKDIWPLQKNGLIVQVFRFLLIIPLIYFIPYCWVILIITAIVRVWGNNQLHKINLRYILPDSPIDKEFKIQLLSHMKRILPGSIYYCLSGQITIWIVSLIGNHKTIASFGALGRFSLLFSIFPILFGSIIAPAFAKLKNTKSVLISKAFIIQLLIILGSLLILLFFYTFSDYILLVLGSKYSNYNFELVLSILSGLLGIAAGLSYSLNTSRGWSMNPIILIFVNFVSLVIGVFFFKIDSLKGIIVFNIFINAIQYIMNTFFCFFKIYKLPHLT